MYLFLGKDRCIRSDEIVGIFDLEATSTSRLTKVYLRWVQQKQLVTAVTEDLPKSFVVCEKEGDHRVYLTQISPATLKKRVEQARDLPGP